MSQDAPTPTGGAAIDEELARYGRRNVTLRLVDTLLKGLPEGPELADWSTLEGALTAEELDPAVAARARELAGEPGAQRALFAAKSIDTGDTGITILTGVRTALSLFLGDKGPGAGADAQQRTDAALKALGIAYLATQLIPREPENRVAILHSLPAGRALILYYAAVEVALPLGHDTASGTYVTALVEQQSRKIAGRLLGVIGRQGVSDAQETLAALTGELDRAAVEVGPHADGLAETLRGVLPSIIGSRTTAISDVVAAGADALPVYRFLTARLAVETCIALARYEADPASEPVPTPPEPEVVAPPPAPPVVPEGLAVASLGLDSETAAPAPQSALVVEDPPGEHDLSGVYQRQMPWGALWLIFTRDGAFTNHPPAVPSADWVAHAEAGHQVGTYQHRGDQLEIRWPSGKTTTSTFVREATALTVDAERCQRCDWNLAGHHFDGTWQARGGEGFWGLTEAGGFTTERGTGTYVLGVGGVEWTFSDGTAVQATLYSTLEPDSGTPDTLWIAGQPYDRAT